LIQEEPAIGCIALGLAVDDTAHVLGHIDARRTLAEVYERVGHPLVATTLGLGVGFLVLGLSEFSAVRLAGIATALTLFLALAADILVMPSLLEPVGWRRLCPADEE
jgi:predicted RND superfamily exporter protein